MRWQWNEDREQLLAKLWMEGLSCSQIAGRFGDAITRNAVIGKVHRMQLPDRQGRPNRTLGGKIAARNKRIREAKERKVRPWEPQKQPRPENFVPYEAPPEPITVEPKNRRSLIELLPNQCRWPIGDPGDKDFHFCDRDGVPGKSYCQHHLRVAFPPIPPKRSRLEFPVIQPTEELETLENA